MTSNDKAEAVLRALTIGTCPQCGLATKLYRHTELGAIHVEACERCLMWVCSPEQYAKLKEALGGVTPRYAISR